MTRRTGLVLVGCVVLGGAFGAGTALATAQTTTPPAATTPTTQTATSPTTAASTPPRRPRLRPGPVWAPGVRRRSTAGPARAGARPRPWSAAAVSLGLAPCLHR